MTEPIAGQAPMLTETDGELVGQIFCTYCGNKNEIEADTCTSCGQYIADQGPDLRSRLRRISRYARHSPELDGTSATDGPLIGIDAPTNEDRAAMLDNALGPYGKANLILLSAAIFLGLGIVAIFNESARPLAIGFFLLVALLYPVGGFLLTRALVAHSSRHQTDENR